MAPWRSMRIILATLITAAVCFGAAPAALGATAITSPTDGTAVTGAEFASVSVAGTATTEAMVNVVCAHRQGGLWYYTFLAGGTSIAVAGGVWAAPAVQIGYGIDACRLLALPVGVPTPPQTTDPRTLGYDGPRLRPLVLHAQTLPGGAQEQYEASGVLGGLTAASFLSSMGSGGLDSFLLTSDPADDAQVFGGTNGIRPFDPQHPQVNGTGNVFGLQVDGKDAYTGPTWVNAGGNGIPYQNYAHRPSVSTTRTIAADGALVVTEHNTLAVCPSDDSYYPLGGFSCSMNTGVLTDPHVSIDVSTTASPTGDVIRRDWSLASTNGSAHTVRLVLDHVISGSGREWRLPGVAYTPHMNGDVVTGALPAAAPFSLAVRKAGNPDPDPVKGLGSLTFSTVPTELRFTGTRQLTATYNLSVPATGTRKLSFVFASEDNQAAIDAAQAAAQSAISPAVSIAVPLAGATVTADHVTVSGSASDASGLSGLMVNGSAVTVAGDGSWTTDLPLVLGDNAVAAVVTNVFGATATAQRTVTRVIPPIQQQQPPADPGPGPDPTPDPGPGPAPGPTLTPASPVLVRTGKAKLKKHSLALGYSVQCPGTGPACTVTLSLAPKAKGKRGKKVKPLGRATVTVPAGRTVALKIKVAKAKKALKKAKPVLTVTLARGTLAPAVIKKALKL